MGEQMELNQELFENFGNEIPIPERFLFNDVYQRYGDYYLKSAEKEVDNLVDNFGLSEKSSVLDVGCGQGRLATGLISKFEKVEKYIGFDVSYTAIKWCKSKIMIKFENFYFEHLPIYNARYNVSEQYKIDKNFQFPVEDEDFDIVYSFSVLNHMEEPDVRQYIREFQRVLKPNGRGYATLFLSDDEPEWDINRPDYLSALYSWSGALHCVRFNTKFFTKMLAENGLALEKIVPHKELYGNKDGSTEIYFRRIE